MQRHINSAVLALGLLCSGLAAADEHAPVAAPKISVGDSWTYQLTDLWKNEPGDLNRTEVTAVNDSDILADIKHAATGALVAQTRFTREMNPFDLGKTHLDQAFVRYAFPLEVGKEWKSTASGDNAAAGKRWRYQFEGKVVGWEKVKVPAGEFDALKIAVVGYFQGEQVSRRGGSGQLNETVWYAPAVNNYVKLEYNDTNLQGHPHNRHLWELTDYARK
ncbi:hypothetical protein HUX88_05640 [Duganella sp. BJB1802]|uniref:hypothetical protein n=1 Tax=Duganella sp. BJB1802 TaxID=2744575 RepID=UPI00159405E1|nr:hypothetical protein [Duganella sp. BJB1802]NVD70037.1 hypothetical protein [Duganella sp. BJB1802]